MRWVRDQREGGGENSETKPGRLCGVGARSEARSPGAEVWGEGAPLSVVDDAGCGPLCQCAGQDGGRLSMGHRGRIRGP